MKWIDESKEILGAFILFVVYLILYNNIESKGGNGQTFLMVVGLFWLTLIALRIKQ